MSARIIKFPDVPHRAIVPLGAPATIIVLPVVRIERSPHLDPDEQLARRFIEARKRRRLRRKLPKLFLVGREA